MKQFVLVILLITTFVMHPIQTNAVTMPCSMVLKPVDKHLKNAMGSALVYKVQLHPQSFARTNVSILLSIFQPHPLMEIMIVMKGLRLNQMK